MFTLDIQLKYASTNYSPAEYNPFIKCYLDGRFHRKPTDVSLIDGSTKKVSLSGTLREGYKITTTTALCFYGVAWRANESGFACPMDSGVAHIEFGDIECEIKRNGKFDRVVGLKMYTVGQYQKAELHVVIRELNVVVEPSHIAGNVGIAESVESYISAVMGMEQNLGETFGDATNGMRIPYCYSEVGMQSTKGQPLPAVAFLMGEIPVSNDYYWHNALSVVLQRDDLDVTDWYRLNIKGRARSVIHVLCYEAQYLDYIGDSVDRNTPTGRYDPQKVTPCENFGGELNSADCEDSGFINLSCTNALIDHVFSKTCEHYDIMIEMQTIANQYIDPLNLDVVRGAQVADQVESLGAHANCNYIPIPKFRKWLSRTREGRLIAKELNWPERHPEEDDLPFLVGEGTGLYECLGIENPRMDLMSYVYSCPSLEPFKKPITHQPGKPGSFMLGSLVAYTDYFYRRGSRVPMGFWYGNANGSKITRGVRYETMMSEREEDSSIAIVLHPPVTGPIMAQMEEYTLRRLPRDPLILSPLKSDSKRHHNSKLEFICKSIAKLNRTPSSLHNKVPVFIRPHQLLPGVAEHIVEDLTKRTRVWKVDYNLEEITDLIFGYKMEIFVN
jgi:hypothetical protein